MHKLSKEANVASCTYDDELKLDGVVDALDSMEVEMMGPRQSVEMTRTTTLTYPF
jgi:hypothetical protein